MIQKTIDTVVCQSYDNWELIIVDDGSTDDTAQIVAQITDRRIRYYSQDNQGPVAARNYGLTKVSGEWITYLDSDDEFFPHCLEVLMEWMTSHSGAVFGFPRSRRTLELYENKKLVRVVDESDDTPESLSLKDVFMRNVHLNPNGLIHHRSVLDNGLRWSQEGHPMEDWEFVMTLGESYPEGFIYIPQVLVGYHMRFGGDGIVSGSAYSTWADAFERIYSKHKDSELLVGQDWYPRKVHKWRELQEKYDNGKQVPYYLYYFQDEI